MSKAEKPAAADAPKKSKKMLIIIVAAVLLLGGGAAASFLLKPAHAPKNNEAAAEESHPEVPPKYVELGTFTANLIHEEGDRYLQIAISLKISKPELEEKIKASNPEILHRVNMLLQSKTPSELATMAGKEKLASEIKTQVEYVLGIRKMAPVTTQETAHVSEPAAVQNEVLSAASEVKPVAESPKVIDSGITEVLFTSFIIQ